jgi:uncharacterized protein (TIGR00251 family)
MASCVFTIKVSPNAKKARWARSDSGEIKCYVTSPAVDGKANAAVLEALSSALGVAKRDITILTGHTSRIKRIEILGSRTLEDILQVLGLDEVQEKLF